MTADQRFQFRIVLLFIGSLSICIDVNGIPQQRTQPPRDVYGPPNYQPGAPLSSNSVSQQSPQPPKDVYGPPNHNPGTPLGYAATNVNNQQKLKRPQPLTETYGPSGHQSGPPITYSTSSAGNVVQQSPQTLRNVYGPPNHKPGTPLDYSASVNGNFQQQLQPAKPEPPKDTYSLPNQKSVTSADSIAIPAHGSQQQLPRPRPQPLSDIYGPPNHMAGSPLGLQQLSSQQPYSRSGSTSSPSTAINCLPGNPDENRKLVIQFYQAVFGRKDFSAIDKYVNPNKYIQHNPLAADGADALKMVLPQILEQTPAGDLKIYRSAADGDLVWLHVKLTLFGKPQAIIDIFRVECGKIVEHWDVIQEIGDKSENPHPYF